MVCLCANLQQTGIAGRVPSRAKTAPPNLAEICPDGRKTGCFRSSRAADNRIFGPKTITIDT
ncbi:hypothetical protein EXN70_31920 [Rhizobium rhizogenes]|nr:hypothetical protein EXN70_31920 [Rhizobium rhizogenes]